MAYEEHYFESGGVRLYCTDWNPTGGSPLVMVHGLNVQSHTWDPLSAELSRSRRVLTPDVRGHGNSDWAPDYWLKGMVDDLRTLVDRFGLETFDLVGHSLGARIAIAYTGENPGRVGHLVLSDTGPAVTRNGTAAARAIVSAPFEARGFKNSEEAAAFFVKLYPEWRSDFIDLHVEHQLKRNWSGRLSFKADPELYWLLGSAGAKESDRVWEGFLKIEVPILLIRGSSSPFVDDELIDRFKAANGNFSYVDIDAGHYVPREKPDEFLSALAGFLGSVA
jgi:pimeloyl-ACP methyl ester carboxylesterase